MMFAHGFGCDQNMWRFVTGAFEDRYRLVLFDYVGCGQSDRASYNANRYETLLGYARDIVEIAEAADLRDIIFVGHSVSSMIGVLAAKLAPERFAKLVLLVPSACYINEVPHYIGGFARADLEGLLDLMQKNTLGWATFLAPLVMKNPERPELQQELAGSFCAADPEIIRKFAAVTFLSDNRSDLAGVDLPVLILECSEDDIAPPSATRFVHEQLRGSTLYTLNATGHCPHMSHPQETIAAINIYLNRAGHHGATAG